MGLLTPIAVKVGSIPWLPRYLSQIMWVDNLIRRVTRGRITLLDIAGLPNLVLTVRGRKSGIPRSMPPGQTQLTRSGESRCSTASALVSPTMPCLAAVYAAE